MNNFSPNPSDSGYVDSSEIHTSSFQNGTPCNRKRKASCIDNCKHNLSEFMDYCSPQFSSTLNGSFMNTFEKIHLNNNHEKDSVIQSQSSKMSKFLDKRKFCSVPNTPEQQVKYSRDTITKKANTNSFIKNFAQFGMQSQSPLNKEAYDILYPELPSLEGKKPATPLKNDKSSNHVKKRLFHIPKQNLLKTIISNNVIMNIIFKDLSNGDLYRLAQVSNGFKEAILSNHDASSRYLIYSEFYKHHKENYRITPPGSPEKDSSSDTEQEASPGSKNFINFVHFAKKLNRNQSLIKCPQCQKPSVVENDIAQCQNFTRCGYIVCIKCDSFANSPKAFIDKCNNARLLNTTKHRSLLGDLSNCTTTSDYMTDISNSIFSSSFNLNMSNRDESSGTFSDYAVSTPKHNVKRNLSKSFMDNSEVKIFSASNARIVPRPMKKLTRKTSLVPVIPLETTKTSSDITEPPSPPKIQQHLVCSKQKSEKRLPSRD
ncbi:uncharacterized protein LOC130902406 [Diorhabda carinulata]|uniref:uncharacterized protein LOC130902406 n=1 Tax=Diorhabda carinulata TaxID=1163345 RepID=UPI0025A1300C|nr:uncharacterized protein LOC130902406 [Diorhabda carinulata]